MRFAKHFILFICTSISLVMVGNFVQSYSHKRYLFHSIVLAAAAAWFIFQFFVYRIYRKPIDNKLINFFVTGEKDAIDIFGIIGIAFLGMSIYMFLK